MTLPKHVNFHAKKLFGEMGRIVDGSVAYIKLNGGGPTELHPHEHNHLFIVSEGEARIQLGDETVIIHKDEALLWSLCQGLPTLDIGARYITASHQLPVSPHSISNWVIEMWISRTY